MSERTKNAKQAWARAIEYVLLACGLTLLALWGAARVQSITSSRIALRRFAALDSATAATSGPIGGYRGIRGSPGVDVSLWAKKRAQSYLDTFKKDLPATPLALLRIPKVNLEAPVFEGTDSLTLNYAVGRIPGTARLGERGNVGLAGHRDGFFRALKDVRVGDTVELKSRNGTDIYIVDQLNIVAPQDVSVLKSRSTPSVTLVTCYPFYFVGSAPQRYIVSASLCKNAIETIARQQCPLTTFTNAKRRNNE